MYYFSFIDTHIWFMWEKMSHFTRCHLLYRERLYWVHDTLHIDKRNSTCSNDIQDVTLRIKIGVKRKFEELICGWFFGIWHTIFPIHSLPQTIPKTIIETTTSFSSLTISFFFPTQWQQHGYEGGGKLSNVSFHVREMYINLN